MHVCVCVCVDVHDDMCVFVYKQRERERGVIKAVLHGTKNNIFIFYWMTNIFVK